MWVDVLNSHQTNFSNGRLNSRRSPPLGSQNIEVYPCSVFAQIDYKHKE
jgi:hypothetical protein